ncbi:MAG: prolipoprotein diacylglyceryl transferase [bacterium]
MFPRILHIYGPLWINSYGVMIAIGFLVFMYLFYKDKKRKQIIDDELFFNTVFYGLIAGIVGGRLFAVVTDFELFRHNLIEIFYPWVGGFGITGSILGVLFFEYFYLKKNNIAVLPLFDRAVIYAPLMQSIARWGCFFAGCCYGKVSQNCAYSVVFTNKEGLAPLNVPLHPTQLYFSFASFLIFLLMYFFFQKKFSKNGQLLFIYLTLESISRFYLDFYRGDREIDFIKCFGPVCFELSKIQVISFVIFIFAIIGLVLVTVVRLSNKRLSNKN